MSRSSERTLRETRQPSGMTRNLLMKPRPQSLFSPLVVRDRLLRLRNSYLRDTRGFLWSAYAIYIYTNLCFTPFLSSSRLRG